MQFDAKCLACLMQRQASLAEKQQDPEGSYRYLRDVMQLLLDAPEGVAAPYMIPLFDDAFAKYWGPDTHYLPLKERSNRDMLARLPEMQKMIRHAEDPLLMALKFAQTGNYIDYGALGDSVDEDVLGEMLRKTPGNPIDVQEYAHLREDLARAGRLLYIGDNAGEIVADRVVVEELRREYPDLHITFAVRGGNTLNDVTREDAAVAGMDQLVPVVDNGSRIPGTELPYLGEDMRRALDAADVVIAKGQANFETLATGGYNVYYIFLCKCERLMQIFQVPRLTGMFLNERRMRISSPFC